MIHSDFTYSGITFSKFVRTSGYMASAVTGDRIQIRSTRDPLPSQDGIQRYIDKYGSRLLEISGWVKGSSESDLYDKVEALRIAFDIKTLEAAGNYGFQPLDWTDPGQSAARYYVKPLNNTLIVTNKRTGLSLKFSVLLEAKDPLKYQATSTTYTITIDTAAAGGSDFPIEFPVPFSSSTNYGQGTVTNSGSQDVFPQTIKLYGTSAGVWTAPKITNLTTGEVIEFTSDVSISDGEYVLITPSVGTAAKYNGSAFEDIAAYITSASIMWKLPSGNSTIRIEGSTSPDGAYAEVLVISSY